MMCLLLVRIDEINNLITSKLALKYGGREIDSIRAIATASQKRSLAEFQKVSNCIQTKRLSLIFFSSKSKFYLPQTLETYKLELINDPFVRSHLDALYDNLLDQNLTRIIEPFSKVQIDHVSHLIKLPKDTVERKLSQMILDKKLSGKKSFSEMKE